MKGRVIYNTGAHYTVSDLTDGGHHQCKIKGNFRIKGIRTTNPVAVGDIVEYSYPQRPTQDDDAGGEVYAYITAIEPRSNYIIRRASNLSKESHIIASNVDLAVLVISLSHPATATTFIDRFLATANAYDVPAMLVINKIDLLSGDEDGMELLEAVTYLYESIGYPVLQMSTVTGEGLDKLRETLHGRISLLSGNSGVGKSTIINALIPDANLRTAPVSEAHDQGQHTTTFSQLLELPGGGAIIDTPGIRGFGTIDFDLHSVAHYFPEIFAVSHDCRFNNCTHTHEPGCAVLEAVENNTIAASRYASYLSIIDDITDAAKYRK